MWSNTDGKRVWQSGKTDWKEAAEQADRCAAFSMDSEDECVADEEVSCYNCRYRRWTRDSFVCMKEDQP